MLRRVLDQFEEKAAEVLETTLILDYPEEDVTGTESSVALRPCYNVGQDKQAYMQSQSDLDVPPFYPRQF